MLRSSNPILSKQDAFTPAAPQYNQNPYDQSQAGLPQSRATRMRRWSRSKARMTFDDVVTKTALTMGVLVICSRSGVDVRAGGAVLPGTDRLRPDRLHRRHVRLVPEEGLNPDLCCSTPPSRAFSSA